MIKLFKHQNKPKKKPRTRCKGQRKTLEGLRNHSALEQAWKVHRLGKKKKIKSLGKITFETDIILVVRVPVLSLQITVVQPKVSTDGKDRTIAFNRAIRFVPRAKHLQEELKKRP